jgi:hypothetical protein
MVHFFVNITIYVITVKTLKTCGMRFKHTRVNHNLQSTALPEKLARE